MPNIQYLILILTQLLFGSTNQTAVHQCNHHHGNMLTATSDDLLFITEEEQSNGDIIIYAKSVAYCPLTIDVDFPELKNMETDVALPHTALIPSRAKKHKIMTISQAKNFKGGYLSYRYSFNYYTGDVMNAKHDDSYVYQLPYEKGKSYMLGQGYGGKFSHQNMACLDFNMDIGSKVCAARGGTVIRVKEDSDAGCLSARCQGMANYIYIYHEDGTVARYIHLKKNGSLVKPGQKVKAGEVIGYSGNTGWSSGPHLHFEVNIQGKEFTKTIVTKFNTDQGVKTNLREGRSYVAR